MKVRQHRGFDERRLPVNKFYKNILSLSNENAIIEYNMKYNFIILY